MTDLFSVRPALASDLVLLQMLCDEQGLGLIESIDAITVAVNDEDLPVGFIHIETVTDDEDATKNAAYVYPVAVFESWQRHGVARALIEDAQSRIGELRLVACKPSQGFYPKVGFEPIGWDLIASRIAQDCDYCVARESCGPVPFRLVGGRNQP